MTRTVRPARPLPEQERPPRLDLISDYPRFWAGADPDRDAVIFGSSRWSYRDLAGQVDSYARALLAAGVRSGDRVATLSPPHPDYYVTFLATTSIGAIWVGLNPRYQRRELDYVLGDATPSLVFTRERVGDRDFRTDLDALGEAHPGVRRWVRLDGSDEHAESRTRFLERGASVTDTQLASIRAEVSTGSPCLIVYTSGTTGQPKGALISHHGLIRVARVQHGIWPVSPLRVVNNLPINHIGCVGDITCDTLVPGGAIIFQEQFEPGGMLELIEREGATLLGHVPTALEYLARHPRFDQTDFSRMQLIIWSGAAAPASLVERLRSKCSDVASAYGMTETVGSVTFTFDSDEMAVLAGSIGWPVDEYEMRIAGSDGTALPPGETGELQVRGDFLTLGYWNRPDATRDLFTADGWLHTGDLGTIGPDGTYRLHGRLKEMFKSGGYNVYPREIETVLESHPDVAMAAVIGVADPTFQEVGHAFVLVHPGRSPTAEALEQFCRGSLANYKVPKRFIVATDFPMLPIGKIDKQALRASQT